MVAGCVIVLIALIFYNISWMIAQTCLIGYSAFSLFKVVAKNRRNSSGSTTSYKFYAKKVVDMRQDLLLQYLTDPRAFFAFKSYFRGLNLDEGQSNGFNLVYKCKLAIAPHFLASTKDVNLTCNVIDSSTILVEYQIDGDQLQMQEIIHLESSSVLPGKSVVYNYLVISGHLIQSYRDAQKQAEFIFMNLQLLDEIVSSRLDLLNPNHQIMTGKLPIGFNHRLDIEGMNDARYSEVFDVKHFGFLTYSPTFEVPAEMFDLGQALRVRAGDLEGLKPLPLEKRLPGYAVGTKGGVVCKALAEINSQDGLLVDMIGKVGKSLYEGNGISSLSLPVRIFEPKSTLERILGYWGMMPYYLKLAALEKDKLERLKYCCTFAVSGFWACCGQKKPFMPILGETLQAYWEDGSSIDMEYTSHIPPVCNFLCEDADKLYKFYGRHELKVKVSPTTLTGQNYGPNIIAFNDGDMIDFYYPPGEISGLIMGERTMAYVGAFTVRYPQADLEAIIELVPLGSSSINNPNEIRYVNLTVEERSIRNPIL
jgi:hypothetical protein